MQLWTCNLNRPDLLTFGSCSIAVRCFFHFISDLLLRTFGDVLRTPQGILEHQHVLLFQPFISPVCVCWNHPQILGTVVSMMLCHSFLAIRVNVRSLNWRKGWFCILRGAACIWVYNCSNIAATTCLFNANCSPATFGMPWKRRWVVRCLHGTRRLNKRQEHHQEHRKGYSYTYTHWITVDGYIYIYIYHTHYVVPPHVKDILNNLWGAMEDLVSHRNEENGAIHPGCHVFWVEVSSVHAKSCSSVHAKPFSFGGYYPAPPHPTHSHPQQPCNFSCV